jgi:FkbM family methyltransferase
MGLLDLVERSAKVTAWAALEAANPNLFWRLRHDRVLARAKERELILAPHLCSPDMIAIDVGAELGDYTIRLCQRAKRVIAFETQPGQAKRLSAMVRAISLNVQVENVALSDRNGSVTLRVPRDRRLRGLATIEQMNALDDLTNVDQMEVRARRLDDYNLADVGFIKIDVEGHELAVLRGGVQTIRRSAPVLLVELENRHRRNAVEETNDFIEDLGYSGYFLTPNGLTPIGDFDPEIHQNVDNVPSFPDWEVGRTYFNNFLFCTPDKEPLVREGVASLGDVHGIPNLAR